MNVFGLQAPSAIYFSARRLSIFFVLLVVVSVFSARVMALVNPKSSTLMSAPWLVDIYVVGRNNTYHPYCQGILIEKSWVLSSSACFIDPFKAKRLAASKQEPEFVIKTGDSSTYIKVEDSFDDPDFVVTLLRLKEPSATAPMTLSKSTTTELLNKPVFIPGTYTSESIAESYFNPATGKEVTCEIEGKRFFSDNGFCYIVSQPKQTIGIKQINATVIDPTATSAPASEFDKSRPFDTTGERLYLDFRADGGFPCHEDLGAPVLYQNAQGEYEVAGLVVAVGMTIRAPVCGPGLPNWFANLSYYLNFIEATQASYAFGELCPNAPEPILEILENKQARIKWPRMERATGYRVHYTTYEGLIAIRTFDNRAELSALFNDIDAFSYEVTVTAYNEHCASGQSTKLAL
jgi:hypothetical protein